MLKSIEASGICHRYSFIGNRKVHCSSGKQGFATWKIEIFHFQSKPMFLSPEPLGSQGELNAPLLTLSTMLNPRASQSQTSYGASLGREIQSLYKWSRSRDQDGRHAHIWSKIFFSGTGGPISSKLCSIWDFDTS